MKIRRMAFARSRFVLFSAALTLAAAGCGGGGAHLTPAPGISPTPAASASANPKPTPTATPTPMASASGAPTGTASITISLAVTAGTSQSSGLKRAASYFSAKTQSIALFVTAVNGTAPTTAIFNEVNLGASGSPCSISGANVTCTLSVAAPVGNDTFSVRTYAVPNGFKSPLSIGTSTANVVANKTTSLSVNFLPVVSSLTASLSPSSTDPIATPQTFTVTGYDEAGDAIGGTTPYYSPIVVATKDTSGHVTATPTLPASLTASGQTVTFAYDGHGTASSYVFTIAVPGDIVSGQVLPIAQAISFTSVTQHLYISSQGPGAVSVYDIAANGTITGPSRVITGSATMLTQPASISVDSLGAVYVNNILQNVVVFAAGANGNVAPTQTLGAGHRPVFVGNNGNTGYAIITQPSMSDPGNETVALGSIYQSSVSNGASVVGTTGFNAQELNSYSAKPEGSQPPTEVCGGALETYDYTGDGVVTCYPNPIVVDGNDYATQAFNADPDGEVDVMFRPDGLLATVNQGIYGGPGFNVTTYQAPLSPLYGSSSMTPVYQLIGPNTELVYPEAVAFDKLGNMYVANNDASGGNSSVLVFPMNATGNVAPTQIVGRFTEIDGVAVGP
jgi:hypothetical protein